MNSIKHLGLELSLLLRNIDAGSQKIICGKWAKEVEEARSRESSGIGPVPARLFRTFDFPCWLSVHSFLYELLNVFKRHSCCICLCAKRDLALDRKVHENFAPPDVEQCVFDIPAPRSVDVEKSIADWLDWIRSRQVATPGDFPAVVSFSHIRMKSKLQILHHFDEVYC